MNQALIKSSREMYSVLFCIMHPCCGEFDCMSIDRSSRLRPRRTCEQEHVGLSNAFLHNSAARAKHTRTHVGPYLSDLRCVVIGQYAMGRSLMDRSINSHLLVLTFHALHNQTGCRNVIVVFQWKQKGHKKHWSVKEFNLIFYNTKFSLNTLNTGLPAKYQLQHPRPSQN